MNKYIVNEENVKITGRGIYDEDQNFWCALSGSGFECRFKGKELTLKLIGDGASALPANDDNWVRYAVYVNGIRTIEGLLDSAVKKIPVICGTEYSKAVRKRKLHRRHLPDRVRRRDNAYPREAAQT